MDGRTDNPVITGLAHGPAVGIHLVVDSDNLILELAEVYRSRPVPVPMPQQLARNADIKALRLGLTQIIEHGSIAQ